MSGKTDLLAKRKAIVKEIDAIRSMKKGSLSTMHQKVVHKNGEAVMKGPYYVLTRKAVGGKTITQSIPVKDMPRVKQDVDNYKKFRELSDKYIDVCEKLSMFSDDENDTKKN